MKRSVKLISKHLQSRDRHEPWVLSHFQRLNSAGHDYKGQLSTAYGQSGFSGSLGLDLDFGGIVGPFVHLEVGASLSGERTAHTIVLIHRLQSKVWPEFYPSPPQPTKRSSKKTSVNGNKKSVVRIKWATKKNTPIWTCDRPIALADMRGRTWEFKGEATGAAWAGVGNAFDDDETGLAVGAKLTGSVTGTFTMLRDNSARHYASVYDSHLAQDVDDLLEDNLKNKAAAWLTMAGENRHAAATLGTPFEPSKHRLRRLGIGIDSTAQEFFDAWDTYSTPAIDRNTGGMFGTAARGLRGLARKAKTAWKNHHLKTDDLIADLNSAIATYTTFQNDVLHDLPDRDGHLQSYIAPKSITDMLVDDINKMVKAASLRISEGQQLVAALERAKARKAGTAPANGNTTKNNPSFYLDLDVIEANTHAQAGAKLVLPEIVSQIKKPKASKVNQAEPQSNRIRATLTLSGGGFSKRIGFRYHAYSPPANAKDPILQTTQDTVVVYNFWEVSAEATAIRSQAKATKHFLATINYRAVIANWFRDGPHKEQALPNGSGVCFGMSFLMGRLQSYTLETKRVYDPLTASATRPNLNEEETKTEKQLMKQLRVSQQAIREFARSIPDWLFEDGLEFGDAFVIESAFAFKAPQKLDFSGSQPVERQYRRPAKLTNLQAYKDLKERKTHQPDTHHQCIRLRYRIRSDEDRTRNLFTLGLNPLTSYKPSCGSGPKDYAEDVKGFNLNMTAPEFVSQPFVPSALQQQVSIGAERVTRVGTEGIVTMHEVYFPERYDKTLDKERAERLERKNYKANAEYVVPPVQLFSQ